MFTLLRPLLLVAVLLSGAGAQAFYIRLHGLVTELYSGDPLKAVQVRMVKDGIERETIVTTRNGQYEFMLDRGYTYLIWFYREGWVTKHVRIDATNIPPIPDVPYYDMDLQISLFTWVDGVDFSLFDQPMGLAEYKHSVRNLNWDVDYTEKMRPAVERVMDAYDKRMKHYDPRPKAEPPKTEVPLVNPPRQ